MKSILARDNRELLAQLAWSNLLIALDYDGTLAPIVDDPARALMRASTKSALIKVAERYPCVVISGRAASDVRTKLRGVPVRDVVGNHGLEPTTGMHKYERVVKRWLPLFERELALHEGVEIEDKRYSLALHYRRSRARREAVRAIRHAIGLLGAEVRVVPGKCVFNVLPEGAPHKGFALGKLRQKLGADIALYVGDDETDEDVFALDQPGQLFGIRVGKSARSRAGYYLPSQRDIDELLTLLATLRPTAASRRSEAR